MKGLAKAIIRVLLPIGLVLAMNRLLRTLAAAGHHLQFILQWRIAPHEPAWFDHAIDQYWKWRATRNPNSWQRGILGLFALQPGCRVLDLCCGGGFYSYYFYSSKASRVLAIDYDESAICHAKKELAAPNIEYRRGDIRKDIPEEEFDNVCWDAGIEYFTLAESDALMSVIKSRLTPHGTLSGCGIVAGEGGRSHVDHKHEFASPQDLAQFLNRHFGNVMVLNTRHEHQLKLRTTFHFFASDGPLPFDMAGGDVIRLGT